MGMGGNGNSPHGNPMGMGIIQKLGNGGGREWEGMEMLKAIPVHLYFRIGLLHKTVSDGKSTTDTVYTCYHRSKSDLHVIVNHIRRKQFQNIARAAVQNDLHELKI